MPDAGSGADGEAHLDGLFTYCLSLVCEHDGATAALGEALALAERRTERGRAPGDPAQLRSWFYALARWACARRLAADGGAAGPATAPRPTGDETEDRRRRRDLAALSWPEAAGASRAQREALELAVRHQLGVRETARVLRLTESAAHTLVTTGAREVERTRAALAAVESAGCPATAALAGDDPGLLLGPGLRRELLRHVDACASCRLVAQRALAAVPRPDGGPAVGTRLTVLPAPRTAVAAARLAARRAGGRQAPRFDRAGFPLADGDRAARRERLRGRALTASAVAAVVAAPVLALWAAYEGAPDTGDAGRTEDTAATAQDRSLDGAGAADGGVAYTTDGGAGTEPQDGTAGPGDRTGADAGPGTDERSDPSSDEETGEAADGTEGADGGADGGADAGPGSLTADAVVTDAGTTVTLTASGGGPVTWSAVSDADWLLLSSTSGTLAPGESEVITVTVDASREPEGPWQGRISVQPAAAVITVEGSGEPAGTDPEPTDPPAPPEETPDPPAPTDDPATEEAPPES